MLQFVSPETCETCRSIFVNPIVPNIYIDPQNATESMWKWRKSAKEVAESIEKGCPQCIRLRRRFSDGSRSQFNSPLFDTTRDIHLTVAYLKIASRWFVAMYPDDESNGGWLTYDIFASTGRPTNFQIVA